MAVFFSSAQLLKHDITGLIIFMKKGPEMLIIYKLPNFLNQSVCSVGSIAIQHWEFHEIK